MDDKELDNILDELKQRSAEASAAKQEAAEAPAPQEPAAEVSGLEPPAVYDFENTEPDIDAFVAQRAEQKEEEELPKKKIQLDDKTKKIIIAAAAALLVIIIAVVAIASTHKKEEPTTTAAPTVIETTEATTAAAIPTYNPFTGELPFNSKAVGRRPVAVVVENEYGVSSVKPQWGIESADMIMEAETEFSTRMLFFWADYGHMPEKIGSCRSARPPFIRFSQLFDGIFVHAGLSHSKGDYVGADTVFKKEKVNHVNLLSEGNEFFARDYSRTSTIEHTGYFRGDNAPELIKKYKFRKKIKEERFTRFSFFDEDTELSKKKANTVHFKWSNSAMKKATFTYDKKSGKYTTTDFDSQYGTADVAFKNIILLLDNTEYIVKENYKGSGQSETYCEYNFDGGKGAIASNGTYVEINWSVKDGRIEMTTLDGEEVKLNKGKAYIGFGSANHGGEYSFE